MRTTTPRPPSKRALTHTTARSQGRSCIGTVFYQTPRPEHETHPFVSIKGGDYRRLKHALERGDLPLVNATAAQLPQSTSQRPSTSRSSSGSASRTASVPTASP